jgi:hypothetical protein
MDDMKRNSLFIGLGMLLVAILASGCMTQVSPDELAKVDAGPQPVEWESQIHRWLKSTLKDYESARVEFSEMGLEKDYSNILNGMNVVSYGWKQVVRVNAKNSFGGYTGWNDYEFFFHQGRLAIVRKRDDMGNTAIVDFVGNR